MLNNFISTYVIFQVGPIYSKYVNTIIPVLQVLRVSYGTFNIIVFLHIMCICAYLCMASSYWHKYIRKNIKLIKDNFACPT